MNYAICSNMDEPEIIYVTETDSEPHKQTSTKAGRE